jgi:uncharacterized glyoxalase superfamily protein PhnB
VSTRFGYTFLWVDDVERAVQFYEQAFGLQRRSLRENGPLGLYAELETGATTLAIADVKEADVLFGDGYRPNRADAVPGAFQLTFVTEDVAATYTAALEAGATAHTPPQRQPWGQTIGRVRDPNGVFVSIASPLPA